MDVSKYLNKNTAKKAALFAGGVIATLYGSNKPVSLFNSFIDPTPAPMDYYSRSQQAEADRKKRENDLELRKLELKAEEERRESQWRRRKEYLEMQIRAKEAGLTLDGDGVHGDLTGPADDILPKE